MFYGTADGEQKRVTIATINSGGSYGDAVAKTGLTRNQVAGIIKRWRRKNGVAAKPSTRKTYPNTRSHSEPSQRRFVMRPLLATAKVGKPLPPAEPTSATNVALVDLTQTTCRWPINDGGPWIFCGSADGTDNAAGRCYCRYHAAKAGRAGA